MRPRRPVTALLCLCLWLCVTGAAAVSAQAADEDLDRALARVIAARGLEPLELPPLVPSPKFRLGQMLFFDPILSGTRDVACATCHLLSRGTSDGVALSVGVDAAGLAEERRPLGAPRVHPRNSMDLWNRGHESVRNMFWDGRVSEIEAPVSRFRTPMGDYLPDGLESVLAAQALFPLAGEEEMLGLAHDRSAPDLPGGHGDRPNEIALAALGLDEDEPQLFVAVHDALMRRLLGEAGTPLADWQIAYRRLIGRAFPETAARRRRPWATLPTPSAISRRSPSSRGIRRGTATSRATQGAIGAAAKRGALLFYGKARCATCHSGPLFSDFLFHSLAVPQTGPGIDESGDDRGRYEATRIPRAPLPVPHAAAAQRHAHRALLPRAAPSPAWPRRSTAISRRRRSRGPAPRPPARERRIPALEALRRASVSPILKRGVRLDAAERRSLLAFLESLEDAQAGSRPLIVPESVPSGLPVPALAVGE